MIDTLISMLILAILTTGAYFAAHYVVQLRHNRDMLADEYKRATVHITDLEARIDMLEAERDLREAKYAEMKRGEPSNGWEQFEFRS